MEHQPATLSQQQDELFTRFISTTEYSRAFQLLDEHRALVDDAFLSNVVVMSQRQWTLGNFTGAAAIADIGSVLDDLASVPTKIDLRVAAGQAFAHTPGMEQAAAHAYDAAIQAAEAANTPYMVPLARVMLGQFARRDGRLDEARALFRASIIGALDPKSAVEQDVLWNAVTLYVKALRAADPQASPFEALRIAMALLPNYLLAEFRRRFGPTISESTLLEIWAEAKANASVVVEGVDPYVEDELLPFSRAIYQSLARREDGHDESTVRPITRYSTNVLTDRIINQYPYFSTYVTRRALAQHLESLSILAHEFTHYWTFLGSLGGYFSVVAVELRLLAEFASKPHTLEELGANAEQCAAAFHDARIKIRMFWQTWRPWAEGLALFAEMDLDLLESGTMALPLTTFLACIPAAAATIDGEQDAPATPTSDDPAAQFSEVEALQSRARARVLPLYLWSIYLGTTREGNERCYFTGHGLVSALRRRWAERCSAFSNSVVYLRALLWLSHSAFDDLVPDWRLSKEAFGDELIQSFDIFLRRLFDVPVHQLAEIAAVSAETGPHVRSFDLWRYLRDGSQAEHSPTLWEERRTAVVHEIAESAFASLSEGYIDFLVQQRRDILDGVLRSSNVHLLSKSECEIRLVPEPPTLVCVARSVQGGAASLLVVRLTDEELGSLAMEAAGRSDGAAQLHQFVLARSEPNLGRTYAFPVGITYGRTFVMLSNLFRAGQQAASIEDADFVLLRHFMDRGVQSAHNDLARVVDPPDESQTSLLLETFANRVDDLYLGAFVSGPSEWIERLRTERLRVFLPASGPERARISDALDVLTKEPHGLTLGELATRIGATPDEVTAAIARFSGAADILGQRPIVSDADRIRFAGLQAAS